MELHDGGTDDLHSCFRMAGRADMFQLQWHFVLLRMGHVRETLVGQNCVLGAGCIVFSQSFEDYVMAVFVFVCFCHDEQSQA